MHTILKTGLAATAALATLFLTALPSAAAVNGFSVTGGTFETRLVDIPLGGSGGTTCTDVRAIHEVDVSAGSGTRTSTVVGISDVSYFSIAGQNYQLVQGLGGGAQDGTISGTSVSQNVSISYDIYETTTPTGCAPGVQECDADIDFTLTGTASAAPDANGDFATGVEVTLDGPGTLFATFCDPPFNALEPISFVDLELTVQ